MDFESANPSVVKSIKRDAGIPLDVHLMITDPDLFIEAFVQSGAAMISVHVEVLPHLHRTVHAIKALGANVLIASAIGAAILPFQALLLPSLQTLGRF